MFKKSHFYSPCFLLLQAVNFYSKHFQWTFSFIASFNGTCEQLHHVLCCSVQQQQQHQQQEQTSYFEYDESIHFTKCRSGKLGHILHEHPVCVCAHTFTKYSRTYTDVSVCVCVCLWPCLCARLEFYMELNSYWFHHNEVNQSNIGIHHISFFCNRRKKRCE